MFCLFALFVWPLLEKYSIYGTIKQRTFFFKVKEIFIIWLTSIQSADSSCHQHVVWIGCSLWVCCTHVKTHHRKWMLWPMASSRLFSVISLYQQEDSSQAQTAQLCNMLTIGLHTKLPFSVSIYRHNHLCYKHLHLHLFTHIFAYKFTSRCYLDVIKIKSESFSHLHYFTLYYITHYF